LRPKILEINLVFEAVVIIVVVVVVDGRLLEDILCDPREMDAQEVVLPIQGLWIEVEDISF